MSQTETESGVGSFSIGYTGAPHIGADMTPGFECCYYEMRPQVNKATLCACAVCGAGDWPGWHPPSRAVSSRADRVEGVEGVGRGRPGVGAQRLYYRTDESVL